MNLVVLIWIACVLSVRAFSPRPNFRCITRSHKETSRVLCRTWQRLAASDKGGEAADSADVEEGEEEEGEGEGDAEPEESTGDDEGAAVDDEVQDEPAEEEDPLVKAIKEREAKLTAEVAQLEAQLRTERANLAKLKDQVSESGKNGYFIVQAQVAEFLKKNEMEQKNRVSRNKREFVTKMLDVVDGFRNAPLEFPGQTEREINMHKNFGSLVNGILMVFEKYGFSEINTSQGTPIDTEKMELGETVPGDVGVVLATLRSGWVDSDGNVIRKALIAANVKNEAPPASEAAESSS